MHNNSKGLVWLWVGVLVAIVIALAALFIHHSAPVATVTPEPQKGFGSPGVTACNGGDCTNYSAVDSDKGYWVNGTNVISSTTALNITSSFWTIGGIDYASVQISMAATSSVYCSVLNPFGAASSTLLNHMEQVTANGIAAAQAIDVATSTTPYATSSTAFVKQYSAGTGQFTFVWTPGVASTTRNGLIGYDSFTSTGDSPYIVGPNVYVNSRIATGTPGTFGSYYTGTCSYLYMKP